MPDLDDYELLDLTGGLEIDSVRRRGTRLRADFGAGYGAFSLPAGQLGGLHRWVLSAGVLTDDVSYVDLIDGVPSFEYYWNFFMDHTEGDEEVFRIEFRGKQYFAAFADEEIGADMHSIDLFSMDGVEIVQRRVRGFTYYPDGSIYDVAEDFAMEASSAGAVTVTESTFGLDAEGTWTFASVPANNETILVNGLLFTFKTVIIETFPEPVTQILRGGSPTTTQMAERFVAKMNYIIAHPEYYTVPEVNIASYEAVGNTVVGTMIFPN